MCQSITQQFETGSETVAARSVSDADNPTVNWNRYDTTALRHAALHVFWHLLY